jgi:Domain of unknown function (DUF4436)
VSTPDALGDSIAANKRVKRRKIISTVVLLLLFGTAAPLTFAVFNMSKQVLKKDDTPVPFNSAFADAATDFMSAEISVKEVSTSTHKEGIQVLVAPHGKYANDDGSFAFPTHITLNGFIFGTQGATTAALNYLPGELPIPIQGQVNFNGDGNNYPFDTYVSDVRVKVLADSGKTQIPPNVAPIQAKFTGSIHEWVYTPSQITSTQLGEVGVHVDHNRSGPIKVFVFFQLILIALMGLVAVIITSVIISRNQKLEIQFFTWLGALVFALPTVRGHMPDTPEIGVMMDLFVYLPSTWLITLSIFTSSYHYIRLRWSEKH